MSSTAGLNVTAWGDGESAVFLHGSFGWGEETWERQAPLADAYRLLLVDRRGFGASPADGRVDFERDAEDACTLLDEAAHLVGHSYGGVAALLAAARRPQAVRSLTVIEPPAFAVARGDPAVEKIVSRISGCTGATDPIQYRMCFLRAFGIPAGREELEGLDLEAARASMTERPPWEAEIPVDPLRNVRTLVVRGDWSTAAPQAARIGGAAFHAVCDALVDLLDADSAVFPSAHNPQISAAEQFNERLRAFWEAA